MPQTAQERRQARQETYQEQRRQAQLAENKSLMESAQADLNVAETAIRRALRKMVDIRIPRNVPAERRAFRRLAMSVNDALGVIRRAQSKTGATHWDGLRTDLDDPDLHIDDRDLMF